MTQPEIAWRVLHHALVVRNPDEARALAQNLYNGGEGMDPDFERSFLDAFTLSDGLESFALATARRHILPLSRHAKLISALVRDDVIALPEALQLLVERSHEGGRLEDRKLSELMDAVWSVEEDRKDGFASVESDDLFADALNKLLLE